MNKTSPARKRRMKRTEIRFCALYRPHSVRLVGCLVSFAGLIKSFAKQRRSERAGRIKIFPNLTLSYKRKSKVENFMNELVIYNRLASLHRHDWLDRQGRHSSRL